MSHAYESIEQRHPQQYNSNIVKMGLDRSLTLLRNIVPLVFARTVESQILHSHVCKPIGAKYASGSDSNKREVVSGKSWIVVEESVRKLFTS